VYRSERVYAHHPACWCDECAHIWMSFIAEIADLQAESAREDHTLPSGTGGKSLRGTADDAHLTAMGQAVDGELASWAEALRREADEKFPIS
jgi:hypothetical protein